MPENIYPALRSKYHSIFWVYIQGGRAPLDIDVAEFAPHFYNYIEWTIPLKDRMHYLGMKANMEGDR